MHKGPLGWRWGCWGHQWQKRDGKIWTTLGISWATTPGAIRRGLAPFATFFGPCPACFPLTSFCLSFRPAWKTLCTALPDWFIDSTSLQATVCCQNKSPKRPDIRRWAGQTHKKPANFPSKKQIWNWMPNNPIVVVLKPYLPAVWPSPSELEDAEAALVRCPASSFRC